jgi:hypothetical protein
VEKEFKISKDDREQFLEKCIQWTNDAIATMSFATLRLGGETAIEPFVLGLQMVEFCTTLLTWLSSHTHSNGFYLRVRSGIIKGVERQPAPVSSASIGAPRLMACSRVSSTRIAAPSPKTKPSRFKSKGRQALAGSGFLDSAPTRPVQAKLE